MNDQFAKFKHDELMASDALLIGRITYDGFSEAWPDRTDDQGFADKMNSMPKYVVSSTLKNPAWNNTHVVSGDIAAEIKKLKEEPGKDILVAGSSKLVQFLTDQHLVDEYRLLLYPVILGTGKRLFTDVNKTNLKLISAEPFDTGIIALCYSLEK